MRIGSCLTPLTIVGLLGLWLFGFLNFVQEVQTLPTQALPPQGTATEAIVVLTGGSERVAKGLLLLEAGQGKHLLISGVHKKLSLNNVLGPLTVPQELKNCCITLGYKARSTAGNAQETQVWMQKRGYTSLTLVTANYHMPRSLLLFHHIAPELTIVPHSVSPPTVKILEWWQYPGTLSLLATEYCKTLIARFHIWLRNR